MSLSLKAKEHLIAGLANRRYALEVAAAIDSLHAISPAATVAAMGSTTNLPTSNVTLSTSDTYTDAAVKAAIDTAVNALKTPAEARLDAIEAKIDELLVSIKAASLML